MNNNKFERCLRSLKDMLKSIFITLLSFLVLLICIEIKNNQNESDESLRESLHLEFSQLLDHLHMTTQTNAELRFDKEQLRSEKEQLNLKLE